MKIRNAILSDAETVRMITHTTISSIYPHYYPKRAVDFFLSHHSIDNIIKDIRSGDVYIAETENGEPAGTVTINGNEINRLFVLPEHQGKGFGRLLMQFAESKISNEYKSAELSASLSAKEIYLKNGYISVSYHIIDCDNGDKLCYDYMTKQL